MPDDYDDNEETDEPSPRDLRQQLAQRAKEAEELRQELERTKRDAEFTRALGDNADAPWTKYFRSGYDGPVEADAIRKAAAEAGFLNPQPVRPAVDDLSGHSRMAAAADGASGAATTGWQEALADADRISDPQEREAAILDVVERFGGVTSRTAQ
ncbi:MAG TPA: hypothetical protein VEG38_02035 [Acidimicrobiia bacterium]|nr:hypothetical protein [Acidimicrobiia bacterium]